MEPNHPLRRWRQEHSKTAEDLGLMIGVTKATVIRYERRTRMPRLPTIMRIMIATDGKVTAKDFMIIEELR